MCVERFDVGNDPTGIAVGAGAVWVTDSTDNTLRRIVVAGDGAVTDTIPLGNGPAAIAAEKDAIWVANSRDGTVTRIDPATRAVEARIPVGGGPPASRWAPARCGWRTASRGPSRESIRARTASTKTIEVGGMPRSVAFAGGRVWVSVQEPPPPVRRLPRGPAVLRMLIEEDGTPSSASGLVDERLLRATCARLMTYASRGGAGAELVPEVATAAPAVSNGGRTYTLPDPPRVSLLAAIRPAGHRRRVPARDRADAASAVGLVGRRDPRRHRRRRGVHAPGAPQHHRWRAARGDRLTIRLTRPDPTLPARLSTFYFCAVPPNTPIRPRGLERIAAAGPYHVAEVHARQPPRAAPQSQLRRSAPATPRGDRGRVRHWRRTAPCPRSKPGARTTSRARRRKPRLGCSLATGPAAVPRPRAASSTSRHPCRPSMPCVQPAPAVVRQGCDAPGGQLRDQPSRARARAVRRRAGAGRPTSTSRRAIPDSATPRSTRSAGPTWPRPGAWPAAAPGGAASCTRATGPAASRGPRSCARTWRRSGSSSRPGNSASPRCTGGYQPRRAVRPVALHLGRRGPGPVGVHRQHVQRGPGTKFLDRTPSGAAAPRREPARRRRAARGLRRTGSRHRGNGRAVRAVHSYTHADFFSARIGCQVEHPLYGIDLAALCIRN